MNEVGTVQPQGYADRHTGMIVFEIVMIIMGVLAGLMIPLMLVGQLFASSAPGTEPMPIRLLMPGLITYGAVAVIFVWLGIGSLMCRRWARALLLVVGWIWLLSGTLGIIGAASIMPQIMAQAQSKAAQQLPPEMMTVIMCVGLGIDSVFLVIIPLAVVAFYQSKHVKATCEARDPKPRWTDACPLPVLALCVILALASMCMFAMAVSGSAVVPCFGTYVSGMPGIAIFLIMSAVYAYTTRACYKLQVVGWWISLVSWGLWMMSFLVTVAHIGILPMYQAMGYPPKELLRLQQLGILQSPALWIIMLLVYVPYLAFKLYIKRYFGKNPQIA